MPQPDDPKTHLSVVKGALEAPELAAEGQQGDKAGGQGGDHESEAAGQEGGGDGGTPNRKTGEIFPGSPVTALGVDGKLFCYLDCLNQLQAIDNHTRDRIRGLYGGRTDQLERSWPRWSKGGDNSPSRIIGWVHEDAAAAMQRACAEKGVWNARERVRGPGAWPDGHGGIILHCGDRVLVRGPKGGDDWHVPGQIDGFVYPAGAPGPRPAEVNDAEGRQAAEALLTELQSWRWQRPTIDPYLTLGWVCAAMMGGALDWRPIAWITGDKGTGKSTLHKLIRAVMGGEQGLVTATDASEAGIRQVVRQSTLPVALDELEAEADNRRQLAVIKLARQAASGGLVLRGGADHQGAEFRVRSTFLFSSILVPPLLDQDISRIALLELDRLPEGATPPKIDPGHWSAAGRAIRRRIWAAWDRLHETGELYRQALARAGHSARGCDQFGTLLALMDLALYGGEPTGETLDGWAEKLAATTVNAQTDESHDWERMLWHLFSQTLDVYRSGVRYTVGELIAAAAEVKGHGTGFDPKEARQQLRRFGIGVAENPYTRKYAEEALVEIATSHGGLDHLFRDTHWAHGVHRQAVRRIPGAARCERSRHFARSSSRAWTFPLKSIPWFFEDPEDERRAEPASTPPAGHDFR